MKLCERKLKLNNNLINPKKVPTQPVTKSQEIQPQTQPSPHTYGNIRKEIFCGIW